MPLLDKPCVCVIPENVWYTSDNVFAMYQKQVTKDMYSLPNLPATAQLLYYSRNEGGAVVELTLSTPDNQTHKLKGVLTAYEIVDTIKAGIYVPPGGYLPGLYKYVRVGSHYLLLRVDSNAYREAEFRDKLRSQPVVTKLEVGSEYMSSKGYRGIYIGDATSVHFRHVFRDFAKKQIYLNCIMKPANIFYPRSSTDFYNRVLVEESIIYDAKVKPVFRQHLSKILAIDTATKVRERVIDNRLSGLVKYREGHITQGWIDTKAFRHPFLLHKGQSIEELKKKLEEMNGGEIIIVNQLSLAELPKYLTHEIEDVRNACSQQVDKLMERRKI